MARSIHLGPKKTLQTQVKARRRLKCCLFFAQTKLHPRSYNLHSHELHFHGNSKMSTSTPTYAITPPPSYTFSTQTQRH